MVVQTSLLCHRFTVELGGWKGVHGPGYSPENRQEWDSSDETRYGHGHDRIGGIQEASTACVDDMIKKFANMLVRAGCCSKTMS